MKQAITRSLPGTRLQGVRHGRPRTIVPVKRDEGPSQCVRFGNPEFPVSNIHAGRRDASTDIQVNEEAV